MSEPGYSNTTRETTLRADYETLPGYLGWLADTVSQPYPPYEAIGTHRDGEWVRINTNVLQIENGFYSTVRPKRVTYPGERPLRALAACRVQYVEVRCMDIDPLEPTGIALEPFLPAPANAEANENFLVVAKEGRRPDLRLAREGIGVPMRTRP